MIKLWLPGRSPRRARPNGFRANRRRVSPKIPESGMRKSGSRFSAWIHHVHELWTDSVQSRRGLGVEIAGELGSNILRDCRHVAVVRMTESKHHLARGVTQGYVHIDEALKLRLRGPARRHAAVPLRPRW